MIRSDVLESAMQAIFGAPADDIHVPKLDHLCVVLTPSQVEHLFRAVGGPWEALLDRIAAASSARREAVR